FTAAMLNNQPMGFYSPATLVKDAQRHGLKTRPIDVMRSNWECTLENPSPPGRRWPEGPDEGSSKPENPSPGRGALALRIGLRYVRGLHETTGRAIVRARNEKPFTSIDAPA